MCGSHRSGGTGTSATLCWACLPPLGSVPLMGHEGGWRQGSWVAVPRSGRRGASQSALAGRGESEHHRMSAVALASWAGPTGALGEH